MFGVNVLFLLLIVDNEQIGQSDSTIEFRSGNIGRKYAGVGSNRLGLQFIGILDCNLGLDWSSQSLLGFGLGTPIQIPIKIGNPNPN